MATPLSYDQRWPLVVLCSVTMPRPWGRYVRDWQWTYRRLRHEGPPGQKE